MSSRESIKLVWAKTTGCKLAKKISHLGKKKRREECTWRREREEWGGNGVGVGGSLEEGGDEEGWGGVECFGEVPHFPAPSVPGSASWKPCLCQTPPTRSVQPDSEQPGLDRQRHLFQTTAGCDTFRV